MRIAIEGPDRWWSLLAVPLALGCSSPERPADADVNGAAGAPATSGTADNCSETLELRIAEFIEEDQPLSRLSAGDALHLWNAPQGGHVVTVGAEVSGLAGDLVRIEARLLDPDSEQLVEDDTRTIVMTPIAGEPDWMTPDIRSRNQVAHIPLCPDPERRTLLGREFWLEVEMQEVSEECGGRGVDRVLVTPRCLQPGDADRDYCECQCREDYTPGSCD